MDNLTAIYVDGVYYKGRTDFVETDKYEKLFYESLNNMRELKDSEILNSLQYYKEEGIWKAEIWDIDTCDSTYEDIGQSIFK